MFDLPGVDYVALGHIHKHQVLHYASPPVVYAGSIDRVDFGEEHEDKGWVLVDLPEKGRAEWEFRKVAARPVPDDRREGRVRQRHRGRRARHRALRRANRRRGRQAAHRRLARTQRPSCARTSIRAQLKSAYYIAPFERTSPAASAQSLGDHGRRDSERRTAGRIVAVPRASEGRRRATRGAAAACARLDRRGRVS